MKVKRDQAISRGPLGRFSILLCAGLLLALPASCSPASAQIKPPSANTVEAEAGGHVYSLLYEVIAKYVGVERERITRETSLEKDLLLGPTDVADIADICFKKLGRERVPLGTLKTVDDLGRLIASAPKPAADPAAKSSLEGVAAIQKEATPTSEGEEQPSFSSDAPSLASTATTPAAEKFYMKKVLFATDREFLPGKAPEETFSGRRNPAKEKMTYGTCLVSVPKAHIKGEMEEPSGFWNSTPDPAHHFVLKEIETATWENFRTLIQKTVNPKAQGGEDALVFIHGYSVPFDRAAMRTAQVAIDLEFPGVPLFFSWPSDGALLSYLSDREDAEWSAIHLEKFLMDLRGQKPLGKIHLIAHSMGSQALLRALSHLALIRGPKGEAIFENVILAAPDFDEELFLEQIGPQILGLANQWTLYVSDKDMALQASEIIRQSTGKRLGQPLPTLAGLDTVDVSGIEVTPWSLPDKHSYFAKKEMVVTDIKSALKGLPPEKRNLIHIKTDSMDYWEIKDFDKGGE